MEIQNKKIYNDAKAILNSLYGVDAEFRDGQYEAIEATLTNKRTLVVQRTGWGKSLVYFACTKLLRDKGKGVALVVSPLLVLMQNQLEAAEKMGLKCDVLNGNTRDRWEEIIENIKLSNLDLILVTPETLFNEKIQRQFNNINIGLFVIDEAHCISDWGHDFRLEYGRLHRIINILPQNVPLLATTATANDRVVEDLKKQFGNSVYVSRGPLTRDSLCIQTINLPNKASRYAWILQHINEIPGSGIIYCITQRDCEYLADFLNKNGVSALAYHSGLSEDCTSLAENALNSNGIKALVATIKLGMGYDKDDISFVIHFQLPSNIVSYYQQIGRAGRNIDMAYAILLHGKEDQEIHNYFFDTAFPTEKETELVIASLEDGAKSIPQLSALLNLRKNRIEKALMFLENEGCVFKENSKYYLTAKRYFYDKEHYDEITNIRRKEYQQMTDLTYTNKCKMKFTVEALDDKYAHECGKCSNCVGAPLISEEVSDEFLEKALMYIEQIVFEIEPKKRWTTSSCTRQTKIDHINQVGICLSRYGDVGYGELVKQGKYETKHFCDELVGKSAEVLKPLVLKNRIKYITCVPSLRSDLVKDFTKRLAENLQLDFIETLAKTNAQQQKEMENSAHQCANAYMSFHIIDKDVFVPDKILLVDDMIDSKWTMTVCGNILGQYGCEEVYPFSLADSSNK